MKIWIIKYHNSQGTDVAPYFSEREPNLAQLMKERHPLLSEFVPDVNEREWVEIVGPFAIPQEVIAGYKLEVTETIMKIAKRIEEEHHG